MGAVRAQAYGPLNAGVGRRASCRASSPERAVRTARGQPPSLRPFVLRGGARCRFWGWGDWRCRPVGRQIVASGRRVRRWSSILVVGVGPALSAVFTLGWPAGAGGNVWGRSCHVAVGLPAGAGGDIWGRSCHVAVGLPAGAGGDILGTVLPRCRRARARARVRARARPRTRTRIRSRARSRARTRARARATRGARRGGCRSRRFATRRFLGRG